ncbi:MAG TPA: dihydrolipoamide acetyltransferase family protein [Candidatus Polarisedimenticolia bacterium]|nr:dihydrolipoamide acetyltransferase family protein [Candidatus Polarisedimenticolia bacterium]
MKVDVIMPQMGESIQEGTVVKWLKKPGDKVKRDEPILEISTDKVDAEIPSPAAGVLSEIKINEGKTVEIKTVLGTIETEGTAAAGAQPPKAEAQQAAEAPPKAEAQADGAPSAKSRPSGDGKGDGKEAPAAAKERKEEKRAAPEESEEEEEETPREGQAESPRPAPSAAPLRAVQGSREERLRTRSSPLVRRIAQEHNLDISSMSGSGISGRVTKKDILAAMESGGAAAAAPAAARPAPSIAFKSGERTKVEPLSVMRRKIAEHMVASKRTSAHVHSYFEVDYTAVDRIRKEKKDEFLDRHGVKLTYLPFILLATVEALKAFPVLNASMDGENLIYKKDINLGVAVALDWGLIVPVIKNAEERNLAGLAKATVDLAERARAKKLQPDEVQGGTFTITNPGVFGSLFGAPIINQPQLAILGVGTIEKRLKVTQDDAIAVRTMGYLSIGFDHRIIDGAVADQFVSHIKKTLESFDPRLV